MTNEETGSPRIERADSIANARTILRAAGDWLPTLMIGPATVADGADANERICTLSIEYAILCGSMQIPYLDVCRLTRASPVWAKEALAGDGAHPNRGGYTLIADAVIHWSAWRAWGA